jgi:hypothetical protein
VYEIAAIIVSTVVAVLGLVFVRRRVGVDILREQHDVAGVSFAVIGGFYGVLLAFVLVASWERMEKARAITETEANAIGDLYRQAAVLPAATRDALCSELTAYVDSVVDIEWETMQEGSLSPVTQKLYFSVWNTILKQNPQSGRDVALYQVMLGKLDDFGEARRYRLLYMQNGLPPVIWGFLVVFGTITVGFTYFFGMPHLLPQAIITGILACAIACTLVIILEMQTPFSGLVRVPDRAFRVVAGFMRGDTP